VQAPAQANGHRVDPPSSRPQHSSNDPSNQQGYPVERYNRHACSAPSFLGGPRLSIDNDRDFRQRKYLLTNRSSRTSRSANTLREIVMRCGGVVWPACGNPTTRGFRLYRIPIFIFSYIIVCTVNTRRRRQQRTITRLTLICASQCGLVPNYRVIYVPIVRL
jgi:hypothetical protein